MSEEPFPHKMRGKGGQAWRERWSRYAHNAKVSAAHAEHAVQIQRRSAEMNAAAAANARAHGDEKGGHLYQEMAEAASDAADALEDLAHCARMVARHYGENERN